VQSGQVVVSVSGDTGCAGVGPVTVAGSAITVLNDTELSFVVRDVPVHVVRQWTLALTVAGQGLPVEDLRSQAATVVRTRSPSALTVTAASPFNGTHHFLLLKGTDFGPALSVCPDDVVVTVGSLPCEALTMMQVAKALVYQGLRIKTWYRLCGTCLALSCARHLLVGDASTSSSL
jgi:hypothetical protein